MSVPPHLPSTHSPAASRSTSTTRADVSSRPSASRRVRDLWRYRELLLNLVRKELKVKYKNSYLGFVWSLMNPALYLVVFYVVFELILRSGIPDFAIFLLAGLLPWTFFSNGVAQATTSIVGNASLVGKVWFPREILPLAAIGAAFVHYLLQTLVLALALVVFQSAPSVEYSLALPLALLTLMVFLAAVGILLAAVNVYLRDTQHLVELLLLAWFWMTPIVYVYRQVAGQLGSAWWVVFLNPVTSVVVAFQRAIYARTSAHGGKVQILPDESLGWYLRNLGFVLAASVLVLWFALWVFGRLEDDFAEEL